MQNSSMVITSVGYNSKFIPVKRDNFLNQLKIQDNECTSCNNNLVVNNYKFPIRSKKTLAEMKEKCENISQPT
jgi:hypothetical protein